MTVGSQSSHTKRSEPEKLPPIGKSIAVLHVKGRTYPLVSIPSCKVCRSTERYAIERAIVDGAGYEATVRKFSDAGITARGIKRHFLRQHLPLMAVAVRELQDRNEQRRSDLVATGAKEVRAYLEQCRVIVGKVSGKVLLGEVEPTLADGIKAARLLQKADQSAAEVDWSIVKIGLSACIQVVRDTLDDRAFAQFVDTVTSHAEVKLLLDQVGPLKVH